MVELVEPQGFQTRPLGVIPLSDGTLLQKASNGRWPFDDTKYGHLLQSFINQGFRVHAEPAPKRIYKDEFEQEAIEWPLSLGDILKLCEAENVKIRVNGGKLEIRPLNGDVSRKLLAHLEVRRIELRNFLEHQQQIAWREV